MKVLVKRQYKDQVWFDYQEQSTMGKTHGTRQAPRGLEDGINNSEVHGRQVCEADRLRD